MTELTKRMLDRADADSLPADHPLRDRAIKFNEAAEGYYSDPPTKSVEQFLGAFARARRVWQDYTWGDAE